MEEIMQSNSYFIIPLTSAYLCICGLWFLLCRYNRVWKIESIQSSALPWGDLALALIASLGIMAIGQLYSLGYLIPRVHNKLVNQAIIWPLNNIIIFSPIFVVMMMRGQGFKTIFISSNEIYKKLLFGVIGSIVGIFIFTLLRGELSRLPAILKSAVQLDSLSNFPAIFLENVALAFLFVRLKWAVGVRWAIGVPAVLFALAHVPGSLAEGDPMGHIVTFFFLTGGLTVVILYTAYRSRDIIWLGVVHYMMDIVIKAF